MKWLSFLRNKRTDFQFLLGIIIAIVYTVIALYLEFFRGVAFSREILTLTSILLVFAFIIYDSLRFSDFLKDIRVRLMAKSSAALYFINVGLSVMNLILFTIICGAIVSIPHLLIFSSLDVPDFDFGDPKSVWLAVFILYIIFLFGLITVQVVWQYGVKNPIKIGVVAVLAVIVIRVIYLSSLLNRIFTNIPSYCYLIGLILLAVGGSIYIIQHYLEGETA